MPAKINKTNRMAITMKDGSKVISENQAFNERAVSLNQIHLSVRATGLTTLVIGTRRFDRKDEKLYATLRELVQKIEPSIALPRSGPGLEELSSQNAALLANNEELRKMIDQSVADHETTVSDLKQRLAEAEAAALASKEASSETT